VQVLGPGGDGYLSGVKAIAAGYQYSMALMDDGTVWAWGDNRFGSLGIGKGYRDYGLSSPGDGPAVEALPVRVVGPGGEGYLTGVAAIALSAHSSSSFVRLNDGSVWAWGPNGNGVLGIGKDMGDYEDEPYEVYPVRVLGPGGAGYLSGVKSIAPGGFAYVLALLNDGSVLAWGGNWSGLLGNGDEVEYSPVPIYVKGPGGEGNLTDVAAIVSGDGFALALKNDGTVWAWGSWGSYGCEYFPAQVKGAGGVGILTGVKLISAGRYHCFAVKNDGTLWAWGANGSGQLGTGSYDDELFPVRLSNF
jgi:alpha-tubulin suppressor-like RCC1 family protein